MRERRSQRRIKEALPEILENNTYGGSGKHGKRKPRIMPMVGRYGGIKMEWNEEEDAAPSFITLEMTDGSWVKFEQVRANKYLEAAMENIDNLDKARRGILPERT